MSYSPKNPNGQATMANSEPVVLASDQTPVDVDVVTAVLPTGASTSANQTTIIGHLDGVEGLLTSIEGDTSAIQTAVQLIDDAVTVLGTDTYTEATSKGLIIGAVRRDADTTLVNTTNEFGPLQMDANGRLKVEVFSGETLPVSLTSTTITGTVAVTDNSGSLTVDAPVATPVFVRLSDGSSAIATLPVSLASLPSLAAGTNNIGDVDVLTLPAIPTGANTIGSIASITTSIVPGTGSTNLGKAEDAAHLTGDVGVMTLGVRAATPTERSAGPTDGDYVPMGVNEVGSQWVTQTPSANGGLTTFHLVSAGTTNATNIKNSAGKVYGWYIYNSNAAARKVAFHNTSGSPTAGSSVFFTVVIPPTSGANVEFTNGIQFSSGIAITTVTGLADSDSTAVAAEDLNINIFYK